MSRSHTSSDRRRTNSRPATTHRAVRKRKQHQKMKRLIELHLMPTFQGRLMVSITPVDIDDYIDRRKQHGIVAHKGEHKGERIGGVTNAAINRSLQLLRRIFNVAVKAGLLYHRPHIGLLEESSARTGFFEPEQFASLHAHLPASLQPVIEFAYITGWRITSEVFPLEWRTIDFAANEVRLDPGTTKNREGRVIHMTTELRALLETQLVEHERLKQAGHIFPFVFFREIATGRGGKKYPKRICAFTKAWKTACRTAGCPGRIPHDLRRTAVRNLERRGVPRTVAMRVTGHKTESVYKRYDIVSEGDLADAARLMSGGHALRR
jgi:integrase